MTREQYETIKSFAHNLTEKRLQVPDGQLLDACQEHLDAMLEELADNFEEHPHINDPEQHIEEDLPSGMFDAREPEPPPPPVHSEPAREVRHQPHQAVAHKRPTPRKTRR